MAALAGKLVRGGHDAAGAGAAAAKGDRADAEARPGVFREGGAAADDERRTEAVHGDGLFAKGDEAVVEVGERGFADDEEGVAVGEIKEIGGNEATVVDGGSGCGGGEGRAVEDGATEFFADADKVAGDTEEGGEPGGDVAATVFGEEAVTPPNGDGAQRGGCERAQGYRNFADAVGAETEGGRGQLGRDECHARERALGEVRAVFVDHQKAAVTDETEGVDVGGRDGAPAEGFDGVEEEAGEVHRSRWDEGPSLPSQCHSGDDAVPPRSPAKRGGYLRPTVTTETSGRAPNWVVMRIVAWAGVELSLTKTRRR